MCVFFEIMWTQRCSQFVYWFVEFIRTKVTRHRLYQVGLDMLGVDLARKEQK